MNRNDYGFWLYCTALVVAGFVVGFVVGAWLVY